MLGFTICFHRRQSLPRASPHPCGFTSSDHYVVCLDCGKEWEYDWQKMRRGSPVTQRIPLTEIPEGGYSQNRDGLKRLQDSR
jgi:hypothetical protein